jgi:ectoine hydroxylase-related dioxygenase (phytanoyl-CoA dioxygenase family)
MTATLVFPTIKSSGIELQAESLGWLEESTDLLGNGEALRARIDRDGYLLLRGVLDPVEVMKARASVCRHLAADGHLDAGHPEIEAVWNRRERTAFKPEYANKNPEVERLLYGGRMLGFFAELLGGPVAHYDFTWLRAMAPGGGSASHCDVVYMGRGDTRRLYTCWTPLGDVGFDTGGLMVLEGSSQHEHLRETYGKHDVDTHCDNKHLPDGKPAGDGWGDGFEWVPGMKGQWGTLGPDCNRVQKHLGAPRWLTTEYRAGDILVFGMYTVHASMDNASADRIRLSTDSRYQPLGTAMDDRWIGEEPVGHSQAGKRGRIC